MRKRQLNATSSEYARSLSQNIGDPFHRASKSIEGKHPETDFIHSYSIQIGSLNTSKQAFSVTLPQLEGD